MRAPRGKIEEPTTRLRTCQARKRGNSATVTLRAPTESCGIEPTGHSAWAHPSDARLVAGCHQIHLPHEPGQVGAIAHAGREWFVDRAIEMALTFTSFNGMSGEFYYPEMAAGCVGVLDTTRRRPDVFFVQTDARGKTLSDATIPPASCRQGTPVQE